MVAVVAAGVSLYTRMHAARAYFERRPALPLRQQLISAHREELPS
jgi:hypothetical protein